MMTPDELNDLLIKADIAKAKLKIDIENSKRAILEFYKSRGEEVPLEVLKELNKDE